MCHSDGGARANSCAGAAWIIEARVVRDDQRHIFPVAMAGLFLQDPVSSFVAEAIALNEAVNHLGKYLLLLYSHSFGTIVFDIFRRSKQGDSNIR